MIATINRLIMLIPQRRSYRQLVFVFTLILLLASLGTISLCNGNEAPSDSPWSNTNGIGSSPTAYLPLALSRYRILMQIWHQSGVSPLPKESLFTRDDVLFPLGQSDKVYILKQGYAFTNRHSGYPLTKLACYKSIGKGVKLLYSVKLKIVYKPPKDKIRVRNMLDYLSLLGDNTPDPQWKAFSYTIPKNISNSAKHDLSVRQGLVDYSYIYGNSVLYVKCFTTKDTESLDEHRQGFDVQGRSLAEQSQWYKTYGFPVADCEWAVLNKEKKGK